MRPPPHRTRGSCKAGIDRDHVNRLGWTALHEAVVLGDGGPAHVATVRALVRGGVDVAVPDGDGVTALEHASERGFDRIARILRTAPPHTIAGMATEERRITGERDALFTTLSGEPIRPLYTEEDLPRPRRDRAPRRVSVYARRVSEHVPGPAVDDAPVRGFGTAEETNERFRYLLDHGQTGSRPRSTCRR